MIQLKRINIYTVKQVKEKGGLYDIDTKNVAHPDAVYDIAKEVLDLHNESVEKFCILTLNTKNVVAGVHVISTGTLNSTMVHPREVFKAAILNNAHAIILFHNHPSGNPKPSNEDINITNRLCDAGNLLGIKVLDHVIIGDNQYLSFKEKNLI